EGVRYDDDIDAGEGGGGEVAHPIDDAADASSVRGDDGDDGDSMPTTDATYVGAGSGGRAARRRGVRAPFRSLRTNAIDRATVVLGAIYPRSGVERSTRDHLGEDGEIAARRNVQSITSSGKTTTTTTMGVTESGANSVRRMQNVANSSIVPYDGWNTTTSPEGAENATSNIFIDDDEHYVTIEENQDFVQIDLADYFCVEDFVNWRMIERNSSSTMDSATTTNFTTSNLTAAVSTSLYQDDEDVINSTRSLTILARRGRCSFESKARMALILNNLLANSGRKNRIDYVIVYNNGTNHSQNEGEKLINMENADTNGGMSIDEDSDTTVGLLYVTTSSGDDLLRRIKEREVSSGRSPYLNVSMLFQGDTESQNRAGDDFFVDSSTIDDGTQGTIGQDAALDFHDQQISHGWFFPATLTRFCHSCGPPYYGFARDSNDENADQENGEYSEAFPSYPSGDILDMGYDQTTIDFRGDHPYHDDSLYYSRAWLEAIRKMMVAILVLLLVGPILLVAKRWYTVGGTVRITRDENGSRRVRVVSPNLEVFVNGIPGTVEANGTKLDRAQVFSLPEIEYAYDDDKNGVDRDGTHSAVDAGADECTESEEDVHQYSEGAATPHLSATGSSESYARGQFVSSSCCSICIDEFIPGERLRMLPRCNHVFHTECILPWLTERQGCCPVCKTPVLPEELQRSHARSPQQGLQSIRLGRRQRSHQPQSTSGFPSAA
ncbi:hypothetical protein ACHAXA_009658, partial [Cyclostephanos tholiformis]